MLMYDNVLSSRGNYNVHNTGRELFQLSHEDVSAARRPDDDITAIRRESAKKCGHGFGMFF